jgi:hypothetical protein
MRRPDQHLPFQLNGETLGSGTGHIPPLRGDPYIGPAIVRAVLPGVPRPGGESEGPSVFNTAVNNRLKQAAEDERRRRDDAALASSRASEAERAWRERKVSEAARRDRISRALSERAASDARFEGTTPSEVWGEEARLCADFTRRLQGRFGYGTKLPDWPASLIVHIAKMLKPTGHVNGFSIGWVGGARLDGHMAGAEIFLCEDGKLRAFHGKSEYGRHVTGVPLSPQTGEPIPFDVGSYSAEEVTKRREVPSRSVCSTPWGECDTCQHGGGHKSSEEYRVHEFRPSTLLDKLTEITLNIERYNRKPAAYSRWGVPYR